MRPFYEFNNGIFRAVFDRKFGLQNLNNQLLTHAKFNGHGKGGRGFSHKILDNSHNDWLNYKQTAKALVSNAVNDRRFNYDVEDLTKFPKSYDSQLQKVPLRKCLGLSPLFTLYANPISMISFATKYLLSYRFFFIYMARTTFQVSF
ncbi:hypothetical protein BdWA1_002132 [Babesia duncani]|uniref:Uncharacterized protein n=1 Tax=Babesia duncani TaxID=323732 RepID=A0AAD9UPA5_9APIC|nr:hypothetical protein BdWA1_002132 [Babesia duncani]